MSGGWFYGQKELSDLLVHQCEGWKVVEGRSETKEQMEENPKRCKITFQMQVWKLHEFFQAAVTGWFKTKTYGAPGWLRWLSVQLWFGS